MTTALPHSSIQAQHRTAFLEAVVALAEEQTSTLEARSDFKGLFKSCTAAYAVATKLAPHTHAAVPAIAGMARRIPLLVVIGQLDLAFVELRRVCETTAWVVYFSDHPVEWDEFARNPGRGFVEKPEEPITWAAHRESRFYLRYARERFKAEPSGLATAACDAMITALAELSAYVHPSKVATGLRTVGSEVLADIVDTAELGKLAPRVREILAAAVLLIVARWPMELARLDAVERAWLDYLIGDRRKTVRGGPFGLKQADPPKGRTHPPRRGK